MLSFFLEFSPRHGVLQLLSSHLELFSPLLISGYPQKLTPHSSSIQQQRIPEKFQLNLFCNVVMPSAYQDPFVLDPHALMGSLVHPVVDY